MHTDATQLALPQSQVLQCGDTLENCYHTHIGNVWALGDIEVLQRQPSIGDCLGGNVGKPSQIAEVQILQPLELLTDDQDRAVGDEMTVTQIEFDEIGAIACECLDSNIAQMMATPEICHLQCRLLQTCHAVICNLVASQQYHHFEFVER